VRPTRHQSTKGDYLTRTVEQVEELDRLLSTDEQGRRVVRIKVTIGEPENWKPVFLSGVHSEIGVSVAGYENTPEWHAKVLRMIADIVEAPSVPIDDERF
jgi:hypothetical protein